ncbi:MAG: DegT/DnrJ/EryC1/StrS family aminotransferase [Chloroflexi bacterium]|nr:MAG: putative aminotransferase [Chloroflexi bacterium OLB13]MBC6956913.1 DegT/DnrJ/EryC1/StrS family aminotransferase [Chloroflexota bacterium]MDL1916800.1 DegT/DnrJ/EryC1/StrS family aminotransferase [Anaerolineae bacterium CFX4]
MVERTRFNIPISRPQLGVEEEEAVLAVLRSGQITQGERVAAFEAAFAAYHGAEYAIATSNGTTALSTVIMAHGIGAGDEVIIPSFSFFATASSVSFTGAVPVFADIDPKTFNLSPEAVEAAITPRTAAIMPVHLYGQPADMSALEAIARKHGLILLEDAAQAHGAKIGERSVGTWGTASFSFYATKNMTTTEGGMILTNDAEIARKARIIRNQGMDQQYEHVLMGFNLRMTNLTAAIGLVQLDKLPQWTAKRRENAALYDTALTSVETPYVQPGVTHVYHQYTVRVKPGIDRDVAVKQLNGNGIGVRTYYPKPIHRQPVYAREERYARLDLPETERAVREVFSLPVHPGLSSEELEFIIDEVNALC